MHNYKEEKSNFKMGKSGGQHPNSKDTVSNGVKWTDGP